MHRRHRRSLALILLASALALALPAAAGAEEAVTYTEEKLSEYDRQLTRHEVSAVAVNRRARHLHVTLRDGRHMLVSYEPGEEGNLVAGTEAKGVHVTILKTAATSKPAKKAVHHKLRYIAAGILLAVIVVVGAVILIDRRRKATVE
jgi:hypothetical protein